MKKDRVAPWFVEPIDGKTIESAVVDLLQSYGVAVGRVHRGKLDNEGVPHDVVEVPYRFIVRMECNAAKFELKFRIFTHVEGESAMRMWPFGNHKNLAQMAEIKRVAGEISKRKKPTKHTIPKRK